MTLLSTLKDGWRKNAPEVLGFLNGALPDFVTARLPREDLRGVPVFAYHLVQADAFEADLEFLATNQYETLGGSDFVNYLEGKGDVATRSVVLTFDDGPKNFFEVAFPILERYRARALAFIAPGLHADAGVDDDTDARPMTWQEIATIHASGLVEFQSHTLREPLRAELAAAGTTGRLRSGDRTQEAASPAAVRSGPGAISTRTRTALAGSKGRSARIPDVSWNTHCR